MSGRARFIESVTVGSAECRVDPQTGNNLMVSNSKDVAICQMYVDNNLVLRGNTGRVMVRDNKVCTNIRVVDNDLLALRVRNNVYTVNFDLRRNTVAGKTLVQDNTEFDGTPAACRHTTGSGSSTVRPIRAVHTRVLRRATNAGWATPYSE
jgi:hypothetical protein